MPRAAQQMFGFADRPYGGKGGFFPSAKPSVYETAYAGYNPVNEFLQEQNAEIQGELAAQDYSGPTAVAGLQRLVASGGMSPQQATAISRMNRGGNTDQATGFLQEYYTLNPQDSAYHQRVGELIQKYPTSVVNPRVASLLERERAALMKPRTQGVPKELMKSYATASVNPTDTAKAKYMKEILGVPNPSQGSSEQWRKAFNEQQQANVNDFLGKVSAHVAAGGRLTPEMQAAVQQFMPQKQAMQPNVAVPSAPMAPQVAAPTAAPHQSTDGGQSHVVAPNGKVYYFQSPEQAAAFRAKAGL